MTPTEKYHYLGAAGALASAVARAALLAPAGDRHQVLLGQTLIRFGDALGRERATRTHLAVSYAVQRMGLELLEPTGGKALQRYADSLQLYAEAAQAKYALLEPATPDNIALQERVAGRDADPMWRREAVWALGETLGTRGMGWQYKATLAQVAAHDADPSVRAAAAATWGEIARHGAVIRR